MKMSLYGGDFWIKRFDPVAVVSRGFPYLEGRDGQLVLHAFEDGDDDRSLSRIAVGTCPFVGDVAGTRSDLLVEVDRSEHDGLNIKGEGLHTLSTIRLAQYVRERRSKGRYVLCRGGDDDERPVDFSCLCRSDNTHVCSSSLFKHEGYVAFCAESLEDSFRIVSHVLEQAPKRIFFRRLGLAYVPMDPSRSCLVLASSWR